MKKSLRIALAAAGLLGGVSLAAAQQNLKSEDRGLQGQTGGQEGQPSGVQGQTQGRSAAEGQNEPRYGKSGAMDKEQPTGKSGATEKAPSQSRSAAEEKNEQPMGKSGAGEKTPSQGRSAAEEKKGQHSGQTGTMKNQAQAPSGVHGKPGTTQGRSAAEQNRVGGATEGRSAVSTPLTQDQKTRIHQAVTSGNFQRAGNVNFALNVGTVVPDTVQLYPVPESIVEIVPQYSGFDYIFARQELIIIDPDTLEIVAIVPA